MSQNNNEQLSADLIKLRHLQSQIQAGRHPIYSSQLKNLPSPSFNHHPGYPSHPQSQPITTPHPHHQDPNHQPFHHPTKPITSDQVSNPNSKFHHQSEPITRYSPTQPLLDHSIPTEIPPYPQNYNHHHIPYPSQRLSFDSTITSSETRLSTPIHEPPSRDPRLQNRLSSQSDQNKSLHPKTKPQLKPPSPPVPNYLPKPEYAEHPKNAIIGHHHPHQQSSRANDEHISFQSQKSLELQSPRSTECRDDPSRDYKQAHSEKSHSRQSNGSRDQQDQHHSDQISNYQPSRQPHRNQPRNQPQQSPHYSTATRAPIGSLSSAEHPSDNDHDDEVMDSSDLEADQKRYQAELARYHQELEIYRRKMKEREALSNSNHSISKKKANERRRDSAGEYFKRSLETVGDPSNQNRRFSLAGERSTLVPSFVQAPSPTRSQANRVDSTNKTKVNETGLNPENEAVEAAAVLLGLGLSRSTVSVNTTTTTTSTIITKTRKVRDPIDHRLAASSQSSDASIDELDLLAPRQTKKPMMARSASQKKNSPASSHRKNHRPSPHNTQVHLDIQPHPQDKPNQLMVITNNHHAHSRDGQSGPDQAVVRELQSQKPFATEPAHRQKKQKTTISDWRGLQEGPLGGQNHAQFQGMGEFAAGKQRMGGVHEETIEEQEEADEDSVVNDDQEDEDEDEDHNQILNSDGKNEHSHKSHPQIATYHH